MTADHGLAGARDAENYSELHQFHLDLRDVKAFAVCITLKNFVLNEPGPSEFHNWNVSESEIFYDSLCLENFYGSKACGCI